MCEIRVIRKGAGMQPRVGAEQISTGVWAEVESWRALGVGQVKWRQRERSAGSRAATHSQAGAGGEEGAGGVLGGRNHSLDGGKSFLML